MPVRTQVSVYGFTENEVASGLQDLKDEFSARPWLDLEAIFWDGQRGCLVIAARIEGDDPAIQGGVGGAILDDVSDAIFATMPDNESAWRFEIDESRVV